MSPQEPPLQEGSRPSPSRSLRALWAIGIGTCLSLLGDATLYAVLPTQTQAAGVAVASLGILLSANRWVRLALNRPMGSLYDRFSRKPLFIASLFIGALSTGFYALTAGFWPLLVARLLWGLSWAGIWVGGNTILLDITEPAHRGRWVGYYQVAFYLGASSGFTLGGLLTDRLGYHQAMTVHALLTLAGALVALALLPETRAAVTSQADVEGERHGPEAPPPDPTHRRPQFAAATGLYALNRLIIAGILTSTFGLYLLQQLGDQIRIGTQVIGVATLTGLALGGSTLLSMAASPAIGLLSDRMRSRWQAAAVGLSPGIGGYLLLAWGTPLTLLLGIPMTALTSSSNQNLATALVGESSLPSRRARRLGVLFTFGDLASALGPMLAYALIPQIGIQVLYLSSASLFAASLLLALRLGARQV